MGKIMYEIYIQDGFSAAHNLRGYPGDCEHKHGHNWVVEVCIQCSQLDSLGMGVDFRKLKRQLSRIIKNLDHKDLNTLAVFKRKNPSCEHIAAYIYGRMKNKIAGRNIRVSKVRVCESPGCGVTYYPDTPPH